MVNEPLRRGAFASPRKEGRAREGASSTPSLPGLTRQSIPSERLLRRGWMRGSGPRITRILDQGMAAPKPLQTTPATDADAAVQSALRTLEAEGGGIAALTAALQSDLGQPFAAAAELIRGAAGRLIITGLGKSGHIGRKIAATFASTGTPAFFVHAAEASHGDLGMITPDDVILALSWSGEQPELKNLITYAKRFRIRLIAMTAE